MELNPVCESRGNSFHVALDLLIESRVIDHDPSIVPVEFFAYDSDS